MKDEIDVTTESYRRALGSAVRGKKPGGKHQRHPTAGRGLKAVDSDTQQGVKTTRKDC